MTERQLQTAIRAALSNVPGCVFWRQNVGVHVIGKRYVRYGLAVGSADLIGIVDGRFCALEVKRPGEKATAAQEEWIAVVRRHRGFAAVVTSVEEALAAVERCRGELHEGGREP